MPGTCKPWHWISILLRPKQAHWSCMEQVTLLDGTRTNSTRTCKELFWATSLCRRRAAQEHYQRHQTESHTCSMKTVELELHPYLERVRVDIAKAAFSRAMKTLQRLNGFHEISKQRRLQLLRLRSQIRQNTLSPSALLRHTKRRMAWWLIAFFLQRRETKTVKNSFNKIC